MVAAVSVVDVYRAVLLLAPVVIVLLLRNGGVLAVAAWFALALPTIFYSGGLLILLGLGLPTVPLAMSVVSMVRWQWQQRQGPRERTPMRAIVATVASTLLAVGAVQGWMALVTVDVAARRQPVIDLLESLEASVASGGGETNRRFDRFGVTTADRWSFSLTVGPSDAVAPMTVIGDLRTRVVPGRRGDREPRRHRVRLLEQSLVE